VRARPQMPHASATERHSVRNMCAEGLTGPNDDDTGRRFAKAVKSRATGRAVIKHRHCRMTDDETISLTCRAPASFGGAGACLR
jgi:hypothetical protein